MYLLRCSKGHEIPVAPQSAGGTVACPVCGEPQTVPKLGELRQLPHLEAGAEGSGKRPVGFGFRLSFAALLLVALASAVVAIFAAFRWQTLPVPMTTERHVAQAKEGIGSLNPIQLIDAWHQHEQYDLSERQPFPYHFLVQTRAHWKSVCLTALAITVLSLLVATLVAIVGRGRKAASDT